MHSEYTTHVQSVDGVNLFTRLQTVGIHRIWMMKMELICYILGMCTGIVHAFGNQKSFMGQNGLIKLLRSQKDLKVKPKCISCLLWACTGSESEKPCKHLDIAWWKVFVIGKVFVWKRNNWIIFVFCFLKFPKHLENF